MAQYSVIIFDEVVTFDPFDEFVLPLLGRMRNANVDYRPQMFWATNPQYDHGVYHWIKDFYLGSDGVPLKEKSNIERYFVLQNNKPVWYDTLEEAESIHGKGIPRSFRSIRAHVTENIPLLRTNSDYLSNLLALPEIKRRIYLDGSWTAREEEAGFYKRTYSEIVPFPDDSPRKLVRSWDTASSPISSAQNDPDWTRGILVSKNKQGYYTIEDIVSLRDRPHKVEELIISTAVNDPAGTTVVLNIDPGSAGLAYVDHIRKRLADLGIYCKVIRSNKSKLQRFLPFSAIAEAGFTKVVRAEWNEELFDELERFNGQKNNGHDDMADCISLAVEALNQGVVIPDFTLPDLSGSNPFLGSGANSPIFSNPVGSLNLPSYQSIIN